MHWTRKLVAFCKGLPPVLIPSPALRGFCWYRISVLGRLGSQVSTEKNCNMNYELLLRVIFSFFHGQKKLLFHGIIHTKKLHRIFILKEFYFFIFFDKFSNLNVLHKGLLMQDWVFRLGACPGVLMRFVFCMSLFLTWKIEYNPRLFESSPGLI